MKQIWSTRGAHLSRSSAAHSGSTKIWMRRLAHRWMRRLAKKDPENAPKRFRFLGWW